MPKTDLEIAPRSLIDVEAAFYGRYSGKKQNKLSAQEQIERGLDLAERGEIRLVRYPATTHRIRFRDEWLIKDEAKTGRTVARQGYELILQGIRQGSFKIIVVDDLSRVCRELGAQIHLYRLLKFHGVELYSICDGISSEDPDAYTLFAIKGIINDAGNRAHALRTKRGLEMRAQKGFSAGDLCYGYRSEATGERQGPSNDKLGAYYKISVHLDEADIVRTVFDLKLGQSTHVDAPPRPMGHASIARFLNEHRIPSSIRSQKMSGKLCNWSSSGIQHILRQEKYIGIWRWNKTTQDIDPDTQKKVVKPLPENKWVSHRKDSDGKDTWQDLDGTRVRKDLVIVPLEKWRAVQELICNDTKHHEKKIRNTSAKQGRPVGASNDTLLSGLLICGPCGSLMHQICGTKGGFFGCYRAYRAGGCQNRRLLGRRRIEPKILAVVQSILLNPKVIEESVARINQEIKRRLVQSPNELARLELNRDELQKAVNNLNFAITTADNPESLTDTIHALQDKADELRKTKEKIVIQKGASANMDKLLLTPFALKARYQSLAKYLEQDPVKANAALRILFPEGLKATSTSNPKRLRCDPRDNGWRIEGVILVGGHDNQSKTSVNAGALHPFNLEI